MQHVILQYERPANGYYASMSGLSSNLALPFEISYNDDTETRRASMTGPHRKKLCANMEYLRLVKCAKQMGQSCLSNRSRLSYSYVA